MLTGEELEVLVTNRIDMETSEMLQLIEGGGNHGGKAEQTEELGSMAEYSGINCVSRKDLLQD